MDPLSALGLASNIIQVVDFGSRLVFKGREIYGSVDGATAVNRELESITTDLNRVCAELIAPERYINKEQASEPEVALIALSRSCQTLGEELLSVLRKLKVKGRHQQWDTARQALRSVWKESKICGYEKRLGEYRSQITTSLISILSGQISKGQSSVAKTLDELTASHRRLETTSRNEVARLRRDILDSLRKIRAPDSEQSHGNQQKNLSNLPSQLSALPKEVHSLSNNLRLIQSLYFAGIFDRESHIREAHPGTFNWVFEDRASEHHSHDEECLASMLDWMHSSNGTYWISGKAGSGKSTSLKHIYDHDKTLTALRAWAGDKQLVTARFFFWNAGTEMQKSQQGLLQTLLYHVLRQCPSLVQSFNPSHWPSDYDQADNFWTRTRLLKAFSELSEQAFDSARFCFFIDGLDEYEGDHTEIIEIIDSFTSANGIKVCYSSRPWTVFENAFGDNCGRKLKLQDLTRLDITPFVTESLDEDERFRELRASDKKYDNLVVEIVDRADGVFLWVFLVVRSLRRGLTNSDTIPELLERLRILPTELEVYFRHMLDSVEKVYHKQAARIFLMCLAHPRILEVEGVSYFDETDPNFALAAEIRPLTFAEAERKRKRTSTRVNARCTDLLEVYEGQFFFLHRTVHDFLETPDIQNLLAEQAGVDFNVHQYFCNAALTEMKALDQEDGHGGYPTRLDYFVNDYMYHAKQYELSSGFTDRILLENLDRTIAFFRKKDLPLFRQAWKSLFLEDGCQEGWMVSLAIYHGLYGYLSRENDQIKSLITRGGTSGHSPLSLALGIFKEAPTNQPRITVNNNSRIVRMLLEQGANPNQSISGEPLWWHFVNERYLLTKWLTDREFFTITEMLFSHGARLVPGSGDGNLDHLLFPYCTPEEISYLNGLLSHPIEAQKPRTSRFAIKKRLSRR